MTLLLVGSFAIFIGLLLRKSGARASTSKNALSRKDFVGIGSKIQKKSGVATKWERHPDFEVIKQHANLVVKLLDKSHGDLLTPFRDLRRCIESYRQLLKFGIISDTPFFEDRPKGIRKDADTVLPAYAFPDWLIGKLTQDLCNGFNNSRDSTPEFDSKFRSELAKTIDSLKECLGLMVEAKSFQFVTRTTEATITQLEADSSYSSIQALFK